MSNEYALTMRRYAPNQHALCPHYQAPGSIEKYDTQGIRPYALCVLSAGHMRILRCLLVAEDEEDEEENILTPAAASSQERIDPLLTPRSFGR